MFGLEYEIVNNKKTFNEAERYCVADGGHLTPVRSAEENDFLDEFASAEFNCNGKLVNPLTFHSHSVLIAY